MNGSFGYKVKKLRLDRDWSQQEFSLRAGISTPHISSIERGKRSPSLEYAKRMSNALGVSLEKLADEMQELELPKMRKSQDDLPIHLQNFVLNEASTPYLQIAQRLSSLPKQDSELLSLVVDLLSDKYSQAR